MTRRYCRKTKWPFTTSYHTRFPEYVSARLPVPESWCYALQRRFHNGAAGTFVATQSLEDELHARGFERLMRWSRGVDTELFRPRKVAPASARSRCSSMSAASRSRRTSRPSSISIFPAGRCWSEADRKPRSSRGVYPDALFTGPKEGEELARAYASADVFVFPSLTDTFGLVLLEALASGVPVAAFPVPRAASDVLTDPRRGAVRSDLREAALEALTLDRTRRGRMR